MTPLAYELLKDLTTPGAFKSLDPHARETLWSIVNEAKFFDVVSAQEMILDVAIKTYEAFRKYSALDRRLAFLPATVTWIEYSVSSGRAAYVLVSPDLERTTMAADVVMIAKDGDWSALRMTAQPLPLISSGGVPDAEAEQKRWQKIGSERLPLNVHFVCYASLALINTPRIIGRRQHMPHERVEREKLKTLGLVGKFPLRAWTEIILKVAPPDNRTGEPSTEGHLTGEKCLHFVRTFLRVRMGQLEYVESHWRGNPALGMKRSRYRLQPGEAQQ
jgi:hypothetical protein